MLNPDLDLDSLTAESTTETGSSFATIGDATATWSNTRGYGGSSYSAVLTMPLIGAVDDDCASVKVYYGKALTTISDPADFTFYVYTAKAHTPYSVFYIDTTGDGLVDRLLINAASYDTQAEVPIAESEWIDVEWIATYEDWGWKIQEYDPATGVRSPRTLEWNDLEYWKTEYPDATIIYAAAEITWRDDTTLNPFYVDDVTINGDTYELEPNGVQVYSSTDTTGFPVSLDETGSGTGVFTGDFYFTVDTGASTASTLKVQPFDIITAEYADYDTATAMGGAASRTTTATFATHTGALSLDRSTYTADWQTATVTLVDPDLNINTATQQTFQDKVTVTTTSDEDTREILMIETGANTDTFEGQFTFSTTAGDDGSTPIVEINSGDIITVDYADVLNANGNPTTIRKTASFSVGFNTGSLSLDQSTYSPGGILNADVVGETVTVTVADPDLDTVSTDIQMLAAPDNSDDLTDTNSRTYIQVSDVTAYGDGIGIQLTETGAATGVFTGTHQLDASVTRGDIITVIYNDAYDVAGLVTADRKATASVTTNTGSISLDKAVYPLGGTVTVTVTDPDANLNPTEAEAPFDDADPGVGDSGSGEVDVVTTTSGTGGSAMTISPVETDINTGVFTAEFKVVTQDDTTIEGVQIISKRGDTITVTYHDRLNSGGVAQDVFASATVQATTGTITLDADEYSLYSLATITVTDADMNLDATKPDRISATDALVKVKTVSTPTGENIELTETGDDTNVFTGFIQFTNDIPVSVGDGVTAEYRDLANALGQRDVTVTDSAWIKTKDGIVSFDAATYDIADLATITVNDPDLNTNPDVKETLSTVTPYPGGALMVKTSSDPIGLVVGVTETDVNTGIFTTSIAFTGAASSGTAIRAAEGDTVTVIYRDWTPAELINKPGQVAVFAKDITVTATVGAPRPAIPITSTAPALQDVNGNAIDQGAAGTQILLSTDMANTATTAQQMLYIVQVKDAAGTVVYLSFVSGTVPGDTTYSFGIAWTPSIAGSYSVEVFAWESWTEPTALSVMQSSTITVA